MNLQPAPPDANASFIEGTYQNNTLTLNATGYTVGLNTNGTIHDSFGDFNLTANLNSTPSTISGGTYTLNVTGDYDPVTGTTLSSPQTYFQSNQLAASGNFGYDGYGVYEFVFLQMSGTQAALGTRIGVIYTSNQGDLSTFPSSPTGSGLGVADVFVLPTSQIKLGPALAGTTNVADSSLYPGQNSGSPQPGYIQVIGGNGSYSSEIDGLTGNYSSGNTIINTVDTRNTPQNIFVGLWLQDIKANNDSTIASLLSDLQVAGGSTYSILQGNDIPLDLRNLWSDVTAVVEFNSPNLLLGPDGSNVFSWDFAANPDIVVDRVAVVPEPSTLPLLMFGLPLLLPRRRRRLKTLVKKELASRGLRETDWINSFLHLPRFIYDAITLSTSSKAVGRLSIGRR